MKTQFIFFLLFSIFCIPTLLYSQAENEKKICKEFRDLSIIVETNIDKSYEIGKKMLSISKDDDERAKAYKYLGDILNKKREYNEAIVYLEKADEYAKRSNFTDERFRANILLSICYLEAGFPLGLMCIPSPGLIQLTKTRPINKAILVMISK